MCIKKCTNFETVQLETSILIDIWQTYSKDSRIDFACFSFHVGCFFNQLFVFQIDNKNNANSDAVSSNLDNFYEVQFLKKYT